MGAEPVATCENVRLPEGPPGDGPAVKSTIKLYCGPCLEGTGKNRGGTYRSVGALWFHDYRDVDMVMVLYRERWSLRRIDNVLWSRPRSDPGGRIVYTVGPKPWRAPLSQVDRLGNFRTKCSGPTEHRLEEPVAELVARIDRGLRFVTVAAAGTAG